jgi:hypothetical protein
VVSLSEADDGRGLTVALYSNQSDAFASHNHYTAPHHPLLHQQMMVTQLEGKFVAQ